MIYSIITPCLWMNDHVKEADIFCMSSFSHTSVRMNDNRKTDWDKGRRNKGTSKIVGAKYSDQRTKYKY